MIMDSISTEKLKQFRGKIWNRNYLTDIVKFNIHKNAYASGLNAMYFMGLYGSILRSIKHQL